MPEVTIQAPIQPVPVVSNSPPGTLPPSLLSTLPPSPPSSSGSSWKWWLVAGILFLVFIGVAVWYFSTRP